MSIKNICSRTIQETKVKDPNIGITRPMITRETTVQLQLTVDFLPTNLKLAECNVCNFKDLGGSILQPHTLHFCVSVAFDSLSYGIIIIIIIIVVVVVILVVVAGPSTLFLVYSGFKTSRTARFQTSTLRASHRQLRFLQVSRCAGIGQSV